MYGEGAVSDGEGSRYGWIVIAFGMVCMEEGRVAYIWKEHSPKELHLIRKVKIAQKNIGLKLLMAAFVFVIIQGCMKSVSLFKQDEAQGQASLGNAIVTILVEEMTDVLYGQFAPAYAMLKEGNQGKGWLSQEQVGSILPVYEYLVAKMNGEQAATIVLTERESAVTGAETEAEGDTITLTMEELLAAENLLAYQDGKYAADTWTEDGAYLYESEPQTNPVEEASQGMDLDDLAGEMLSEQIPLTDFVPHTLQAQVDLAPLSDYETLLQQFYTVDVNTSASSERLNVAKFMEKDMSISKETDGPQILIFHTHASEGFADSVAGDESTTIVGAGEHLAQILQETYGYEVLHHLGKYDNTRDDAYGKALPEIQQILEDNPTIKVVIDLHRDEMPEGTKLVMDLDGRPTARFMFFNGLSRTKKTGNISYLKNDNLDYNLAFSFQMQQKALEYYPGLTRKIYLKGYRYNMHLAQRYLLVELGAQNNTVEEAMNACDPLAHILDMVLSGI